MRVSEDERIRENWGRRTCVCDRDRDGKRKKGRKGERLGRKHEGRACKRDRDRGGGRGKEGERARASEREREREREREKRRERE